MSEWDEKEHSWNEVLTELQLEEFRKELLKFGYEMTGEIGNLETWTPSPTAVSHVFYVGVRGDVTYVSESLTSRGLPFDKAMDLISKVAVG